MNKIPKVKLLPIIISIILFIIPFFWLKPGWMDLGGDSSRLYFYDPLNYLNSLPLYGITPDGIGTVVTGYFLLPFVVLLLILKNILGSSYLLITLFNSLSLVVSFLSIYFIVFSLLDEFKKNEIDKLFAGTIAGLFYVFSPILTVIGWEKALTVHNQVFLNPLIFLLLLKYISSRKISYLLIALITSFLFAPNFSPSPYPFSFYPLAIIFLLIYALKVKKTKLNLKEIIISIFLFIGIHLFHLLPMFFNFFSQNSAISGTVFSDQGKFVRGLSYFSSIAKDIKLTSNILSLPQNVTAFVSFNFLWIVFPVAILIGLLINRKINKSNTFLLLAVFFLITLFFVTANITNLGFNLYKSLFNIPGFSMFRNYWGQFGHVYIFFYSLLLGYSLFYVFVFSNKTWKIILFFIATLLIIVSSWSFIRGDRINLLLNPGSKKEIRVPIKIDPQYEKLLEIVRKDPIDGKYLTLPLTDTAYQIIQGKEGGAYMGPSTIAYLGGKKDFSGYADFFPYSDVFLNLVEQKDYASIQKLFSILNIKYIIYNSDENLYNNFPKYPYDYLKKFFPTLKSYNEFLSKLEIKEKYHIGKYYLYSIKDENFLPHFYIPSEVVPLSLQPNDWKLLSSFYSFVKNRLAIGVPKQNKNSDMVLRGDKIDIYKRISKDYPLPINYPFAKWKLNSPIYPFVVFKESRDLETYRSNDDSYIDRVIFYNAKRISELAKWEGGIPVLGNLKNNEELIKYYKQPQVVFDYIKLNDYNSWESVLSRYAQGLQNATDLVNNSKNNLAWKYEKESEITESLKNNKILLNIIINNSVRPAKEKQYLLRLIDGLFSYYLDKFRIKDYSPSKLEYTINGSGNYDIYVQNDFKGIDLSKSELEIGNDIIKPSSIQLNNSWIKFDNVTFDGIKNLIGINIPSKKIVDDSLWVKASDLLGENGITSESSTVLNMINKDSSASQEIVKINAQGESGSGFAKRITNFEDNKHYLISFDYLTYGDTFEFSLWTKENPNKKSIKPSPFLAQFHEEKNTRDWTKFNIVLSTKNLKDAVITINSNNKLTDTKIDIKDFSATELPPQPDLIAIKDNINPIISEPPRIVFTKINPTKYKVDVEGAKEPYVLTFLEAFDKSWKVYLNSQSGKEVKNRIVASYFNGDIKEKEHKSVFLDSSTFETWNKKPIEDDNHFMVNGYANAWKITPQDVNNKETYELVVELQNQRIFYISLAISLFSVSLCILLITRSLRRKQ